MQEEFDVWEGVRGVESGGGVRTGRKGCSKTCSRQHMRFKLLVVVIATRKLEPKIKETREDAAHYIRLGLHNIIY